MGSEEAKENAEFGRGKRKGGPSTKQMEAAEAPELDQQQEAAVRTKRKKAPAKSAVESAVESTELPDGTVGSEFELNHPNSASSAKKSANLFAQCLFGARLSCRDTKLLLAFCRRCHATMARQGCRMTSS